MLSESTVRLDVVIPVYNEEAKIEACLAALVPFLDARYPGAYHVVVADNGSTDRTAEVAEGLSARWPQVRCLCIPEKGRGRALRAAWLASEVQVVAYMDVDLSTDLTALPPLVEPLLEGRAHVATGTRLHPGSSIERSPLREVLSRGYNLMIRLLFPRRRFSDAQCGFKALSQQAAQQLVPLVRDNAWFFDTELLLRAEQFGYRIHEVPVVWIEGRDSRVRIARTAWEDVKGLLRVRFTRAGGDARLRGPRA
ncbi:MAG: glycosyltransferase family 2 protein [bacterium]|nr:glycosyltransferase family 2 protein [bacterium]